MPERLVAELWWDAQIGVCVWHGPESETVSVTRPHNISNRGEYHAGERMVLELKQRTREIPNGKTLWGGFVFVEAPQGSKHLRSPDCRGCSNNWRGHYAYWRSRASRASRRHTTMSFDQETPARAAFWGCWRNLDTVNTVLIQEIETFCIAHA